jgi:CHAD domain-containing protein
MMKARVEAARLADEAIESALATMLAHEAGTREGRDPEELHKMRVASRRLRAALATFAPLLPRKRLDRRRRELRRLTRALGTVRECDVHAEMLLPLAAPGDERRRRALAYAAGLIATRREIDARLLVETLDELAPERLAGKVRALAKGARGRTALRTLAASVLEKRLAAAFAGIERSLAVDRRDTLHARRIAVKKLRYAIEALAPALPARVAEAFLAVLKPLQEALGRHHDAVTLALALERSRPPLRAGGVADLAAELGRVVAALREERRARFRDCVRLGRAAARAVPALSGALKNRRRRAPVASPASRRRRASAAPPAPPPARRPRTRRPPS